MASGGQSGNSNDSPFSEMNPYSAAAVSGAVSSEGDIQLPDGQRRGMISHVPIIGVLMMIQGGIEFLAAIAIAGYAVFLPQIMQEVQNQANKQGQPPPPGIGQMADWMLGAGLVLAVSMLALGIITIFSGLRVYRFQNYTLGIVCLVSSLLMLFTCYCFPTSLALTVYGLIVLLNPSVKLGFDIQRKGYSAQNIQRAFAMLPLGR